MPRARWIEIGEVAPQAFHDTYRCAAEVQTAPADPIVFWGKAAPHVCLGVNQSRSAELEPGCPYPIARRSLGGGAVWLDQQQYCFIMVVPAGESWGPPPHWFARGLGPLLATYREFGLAVERHERDVWFQGKKIAGSGAATLGASAVFASSFLLEFNAAAFVDAIACPSYEYRTMLNSALQRGMTCWRAHTEPPAEEVVKAAFRSALSETIAWHTYDDVLTSDELCGICNPTDDDDVTTRKSVSNGIKINEVTYLVEQKYPEATLTLLTQERRILELAIPGILSEEMRRALLGRCLREADIERTLAQHLHRAQAATWAKRVIESAFGKER